MERKYWRLYYKLYYIYYDELHTISASSVIHFENEYIIRQVKPFCSEWWVYLMYF